MFKCLADLSLLLCEKCFLDTIVSAGTSPDHLYSTWHIFLLLNAKTGVTVHHEECVHFS